VRMSLDEAPFAIYVVNPAAVEGVGMFAGRPNSCADSVYTAVRFIGNVVPQNMP
jgi:hypothetical protein